MTTTMESLIGLVNRIQRACTALGDYGGEVNSTFSSLWEALPSVAVVGGQSSGKSSVLESIVGRDFLPRGSGIVTRRPLVLQLHKTEDDPEEYAAFLHLPQRRFTDFSFVRKEIQDETDRLTGKTKQISPIPIHLSIFSPKVVNLTLIDLPGLTKVAVEGQPENIAEEIEAMVRSYVDNPNCIILAISPANQDIATSDAIKLAKQVDPSAERTFGVLTKLDLMDKGTNALNVLEGRSYKLHLPWVGIVNRSQADITKNVDMILARRKEREYFATSPDYGHLANKMGSEYLAKLLSQHLESVIRSKLPGITLLINKSIEEIESELDHLGRPIAVDAGAQLYTILEVCRAFEKVFKEHLDGGRPGGDRIYGVFDNQLPTALKKLPFDRHLSIQNVMKVVSEADGYQPHLMAPEQGYRRLLETALSFFRGPAEASVDAVHLVLKELVGKSLIETQVNNLLFRESWCRFVFGLPLLLTDLNRNRFYLLFNSLSCIVNKLFNFESPMNYSTGRRFGFFQRIAVGWKQCMERRFEQELSRFPSLQADIAAACNEALEKFREEGKKTALRLVDMEASYFTVEFFRKLPQEGEKIPGGPDGPGGGPDDRGVARSRGSAVDRYSEGHFRRIASNVSAYVMMVSNTLKNTIPKAVVYCQVREAKLSILSQFYIRLARRQGKELGQMLNEDPALMERRREADKRLQLYKAARDEIDAVSFA